MRVHATYRLEMLGAEIRTALVARISSKAFTVDTSQPIFVNKASTILTRADEDDRTWNNAAILNLVNIHTERLADFFKSVVALTRCLCTPFIALGFWIWLVGWIGTIMFISLWIFVLISALVARKTFFYRRKANTATDDRVDLVSGMFEGVRLIKYFG